MARFVVTLLSSRLSLAVQTQAQYQVARKIEGDLIGKRATMMQLAKLR